MTKDKILVTGGAGFIGSALVWALNQQGIDTIHIADFLDESDKWKNLVPLRFSDYIEADDLLSHLSDFKGVSTLFHLGACSATTERNARYLIQNNYEYTKTLAEWALSQGIRFVYASSAATYGDGEQGMDDTNPHLHQLRPLNMYGYSKHMFDLYAQQRGYLDKIVGLKYFNVFGPNENHKGDMRSLVNKAFKQIQATGKLSLFKSYHPDYKDGEQQRDFLYVKDAVAMTLHLANSNAAQGLFNLGSGQANTWNKLAGAIFAALDMPPEIEYIDMPPTLKGKYQYFTQANIAKLHATQYTQTITGLDSAVRDYIRNYLLKDKYLGDG